MGLYAIKEKGSERYPYVVRFQGVALITSREVGVAKKFTLKGEAEAFSLRHGLHEDHYEVVRVTAAEMAEAEARARAEWERERA